MRRGAFLFALLLAAPVVWAQQEPSKPAPAAQPANSTGNEQPAAAVPTPEPAATPKPGHPLDPHDVDVLTGKADREARAPGVTPYIDIGGYGQGLSLRNGWNHQGNQAFPFVFGAVNGKPFFFFGNGSFGGRGRFGPRSFGFHHFFFP
jgi:hypothetical protein